MELIELLRLNNFKVSTAESCTGGLVGAKIIDADGISQFYQEGYITYAADSKIKLLGVDSKTIDTYGVVSEETAKEMAIGACKKSGADCAVSTTGVAGPGGGTKEAPVGCVCFGCCVNGKVFSARKIFAGDRTAVRIQAAEYGVEFLKEKIVEVTK